MSYSRSSAVALLLVFPSIVLALSPDENLLLNRVREIAAAPIEDFQVLGELRGTRDGCYRYQLAFLAYGLCSVVEGDPSLRPEGRAMLTKLVEKMQHPTTLKYWKALGFRGDGAKNENVMYRGHLNLMYALMHDRFGETRFDERFHELSRALFEELAGQRPICCEPDHLFVQCNAVSVLSLFLHDRTFGTTYASAGNQLLTWARKNMALEGTTLLRENYRPSTGKSSTWRAGCANAWTISFLAPVPGITDDANAMYADWRRTFVEPSLLPGLVKGAPQAEELPTEEMITSELLATTFGLLAAREAGDERLHERLEWTVSKMERTIDQFTWMLPPSWRVQARTFQTIALFARTFRGWNEVLKIRKDSNAINKSSEG
jgi:Linalool dehydratase/isomerase